MKEIVPWPFPKSLDAFLWRLSSRFIIGCVGLIGKFILNMMNTTKVINRHYLVNLLDSRPLLQPIITVTNHASCFDDPGLWSILPPRHVLNVDVIRWSLTAHDICFTQPLHSQFFARGKCVPVIRGSGVYQRALDFCLDRLNEGSWVHVFPEGRVNMDNELIRFKWGVGRLIAESKVLPIVIPFWHCGMNEVLPNVYPYRFKWGKKVLINFGKPIEMKDVMEHARNIRADDVMTRKLITDKIQEEMMILKDQTERMYAKLKSS